jgi:hypothetical protein
VGGFFRTDSGDRIHSIGGNNHWGIYGIMERGDLITKRKRDLRVRESQVTDDRITEKEVKQLKAYLEMKAQSLEKTAKTFTSNYDRALSIAKANGFREVLQVIESSSYKWYKLTNPAEEIE